MRKRVTVEAIEDLDPVLAADYIVPVLWLSVLEPSELALHREVDDEYPKEPLEAYFASVPASVAARRCRARHQALRATIANIDEFLPGWMALMDRAKGKRLVIEVSEIVEMMEEARPLQTLRQAISFLLAPSKKSATAFMSVTCLSDVYDPATQRVATPAPRPVAAILGKESKARGDRFLAKSVPSTPAQHYVTGYKVAPWVPWKDPGA